MVDSGDTGGTIANGTNTVTFDVNVAEFGAVETQYKMTCTITNETAGASQSFDFWVYVSSVYHDDISNVLRDTIHTFEFQSDMTNDNYIVDNSAGTPDPPLEAGDRFKYVTISNLINHAGFGITNPQANLTPPSDDTNNGDIDGDGTLGDITLVMPNAQVMTTVAAGQPVQDAAANPFQWRANVEANTAPGVYQGDVTMLYERTVAGADKLIRETTRSIDFTVDFSFADTDPYNMGPAQGQLYSDYQMRTTSVTITDTGEIPTNTTRQVDVIAPFDTYQQSTFSDKKITVEVVIENNGNTPVYNAEFELNPTGWPYFRNPNFFWTSGGVIDYDRILITGVDLDVGESVTFVIEVIVVKEVPIGEHRLPILYRGFYFDDGSLGGSTGFYDFNGGTDLQVIFGIFVEDDTLDCVVTIVTFGGDGANKGDITSEVIVVSIENQEDYNFIDVRATADFTGTPFYAPLIDTTTLDWPLPADRSQLVESFDTNWNTPQDWAGGGTLDASFLVDTDYTMVPDRYPFSVTIWAIIEETLVEVTTIVTAGAEFDFAGYGPRISISAFTNDDIIPGELFNLDLTFTNDGDDRLRDVWVIIPTDGTAFMDWMPICNFIEQIQRELTWDNYSMFDYWWYTDPFTFTEEYLWDNGSYGFDWEGAEVTLEMLDIDSGREIIELNLYMEGVYSSPSARISIVRVIDLDPGASVTVNYQMWADKDMVNGKPYVIDVAISGTDSEGSTAFEWELLPISVMSSLPGDSYNPVELDWFTAGLKALGLLLFLIIVLAILLWVYNKYKGEPEEYEDEDEFDFEDEDEMEFEPKEEVTAPEVPESPPSAPEELVEP
jgi:cbb3-type cytochrome oxidase subunit 3